VRIRSVSPPMPTPGNPANDGALIEVGEAMEPRLALSRRGQTEK
jgi:hypothetical protein